MSNELAREHWERRAEWPLITAAALFLAAYAWPILDPGLSSPWLRACEVVTWVTWAMFALDYAGRLILTQDRRAFVRAHIFDLLVVALPILRQLRALRLLTLLNVLNRHAAASLRGRVVEYVIAAVTMIIFVASLAILDAERDAPEATITTFGDALWWAVTTVTTVGYGDRFPVTGPGRMVAASLMIAGIALIGVVTAAFASWLVEKVQEVEAASQTATRRDIDALTEEVAELRSALQHLVANEPSNESATR